MRIKAIQASTYFGVEYYYFAETKHKKIGYIVIEVLWVDKFCLFSPPEDWRDIYEWFKK